MKIFHLTSLQLHFKVKYDHLFTACCDEQVITPWAETENYRLTLKSFTQVHRKLSSAVGKVKDPWVGGSQHVVKCGTFTSVCQLVFHQHDLSESKFSSGDDDRSHLLILHYLQRAYLWYLPCGSRRGKHTDVTQWCQTPETFASPSNSGGTLSSNSFHALAISVSVNWVGSEEPSRLSFSFGGCYFLHTMMSPASLSSGWGFSPQFRAHVIFCSFHRLPYRPSTSTSSAATPFSAYVCLILRGVVCPALGVWGAMLRDFQLMGWRGIGRENGGDRIEEEKRRGRVDGRAKCFGPESIAADYLPQKETTKVEWKLTRPQWSVGIHFSWEIAQFCTSILNRST